MILSLKQIRIIELPVGLCYHRIQLAKPRTNTVKIGRILVPPAGLRAGRFCLAADVTAYLADSAQTALYEGIFRREVRSSVSLDVLRQKCIARFKVKKPLRLVDIRGFEEEYPFLHSQRIGVTQDLASECFAAGYDGLLYASSQHPHHECACLFESGIRKMQFLDSFPLVKPGTKRLLKEVISAARRSAVEIV